MVGMSSLRVKEVLNLPARVLADCCWGMMVSSLSLSERKKSDNGLFLKILGGESGCEVSHQLELFKVEMVAVCESTMLVGKLDILLHFVLGKRQA